MRITEIFLSVQGETSLSGLPTTFVRLSGCHLRCSWCDTPYSFPSGEKVTQEAILERVKALRCKTVCVTGGEPLLQKEVFPLIEALLDAGNVVSVETSGTLPIEPVDPRAITVVDVKCPKSNVSDRNRLENLEILRPHDEVKFVIQDREDFLFADEICQKFSLYAREKEPLFSPVHGVLPPKQLVEWALEKQLPVRLNLQIHKYIWSPTKMGV